MDCRRRVGLVGATGMVGQRFALLLENHPWFKVVAVSASAKSAGKTYAKAVEGRWAMHKPIPAAIQDLVVMDASDVQAMVGKVDFVFCAVDMSKDETRVLEEAYAKSDIPVISNNSANRMVADIPMMIPEINADHLQIIEAQRKRLGTKRGFIAVKPNCSLQSYVPAISALMEFGPRRILACTYQAISGASKTFESWPEIIDNVIPYIGGEEEKSENEPLKIWGKLQGGVLTQAEGIDITSQCIRVPASDGHMAAVFVTFDQKPTMQEILARWAAYEGEPQKLNLPSAPKPFLTYFQENDRPQTRLDRDLGNGMGISMGRLRPDSQYDYKFISLSHNTVRGAAGGGVLTAELLCAKGYM